MAVAGDVTVLIAVAVAQISRFFHSLQQSACFAVILLQPSSCKQFQSCSISTIYNGDKIGKFEGAGH